MELAVCKFVGFRHGNNAVNILEAYQIFGRQAAFVPYDADDGNLGTLGKMSIQPAAFNIFLYRRDAGFSGLWFHYNNHWFVPFLLRIPDADINIAL